MSKDEVNIWLRCQVINSLAVKHGLEIIANECFDVRKGDSTIRASIEDIDQLYQFLWGYDAGAGK